MFEILKRIQGDIAAFRATTDERLERLESLVRKQRREGAAMMIMMRSVAGDFDERVSEVEERVAALEARPT